MSMGKFGTPSAYGTSLILMLQEMCEGITRDDITFYAGLLLGVGTFLLNWYYKAKENRRNADK